MSLGQPVHRVDINAGRKRNLPPVFYGAVTFLLLTAAFCGLFFFEGRPKAEAPVEAPASEPAMPATDDGIATDDGMATEGPAALPVKARPRLTPARPSDGVPRLAIVIDDWGYPSSEAAAFLEMGIPLTAAIIPHLSASAKHASAAAAAGYDVLLHLPMEPLDSSLRIDGMVTVDMTDAAIIETVEAAFASLPMVVGMNNHMGSKATADDRVMRATLEVARQKGLVYLDSRTSAQSVGAATAVEMGLPLLENTTFIDGKADKAYIRKQLLQAARLAKERGVAIAIGHVRPVTADAIKSSLAEIADMGVRLARLTELVDIATVAERDNP